MPRRTHARTSQRRAKAQEPSGTAKRQRTPIRNVDTEVLALREQGASYSAIARTLELGRAIEAHRRFVHALSAFNGAERQRLVAREEARLDELEQRIRDRDAAEPDKIKRRILAVDKYREAIRQ
jgi:hypothetical protein